MTFARSFLTATLLATTALPGLAADLTIGRSNEPSSMDPQFSRTGNNQMTAKLMFDRLVAFGPNLNPSPGLAASWEPIDETTWEIKLREGVTFHDGSPLTVEDVVFSLERTDEVPNSPAPFSNNVADIKSMEKVDDKTLRIETLAPAPLLMDAVGQVFIVSKAATENATSQDFNSGHATIGTGPYKFGAWSPGENLTITAYEGYWGDAPEFKDVDIRFITNDAARVAALLAGDVDLIDAVPPTDIARLENDENITVISKSSGRVIYLGLTQRDEFPEITDLQGKPLSENPFKDPKVRKAVSLMIDRKLIIDRILGGSGVPAGQLVPDVLGGHSTDTPPDEVDIEAAKALLTEAGYPDGFGITIYSSNDRFPGDGDLAQALGQMLARGGLKVNGVQTVPYNVYSKAASAGDYSVFVFSLGSSTPSSAPNLNGLLRTHDKEAGSGPFNRVRFSDAEFDAALDAAMQEFDPQKRNAMLADATAKVFQKMPVVPLYWQKVHWAARKGLTIDGGLSEDTLAQDVSSE
ncbi:MAG: ABC transporter substrate-binding protein [Pseudomonadota bacterium]